MEEKIGLLVEGGGMKCAFSAGVLDVFLDEKISFEYCMGISAGAANTASFLAGQRDRNRRFYCIHVKDPHYVSVKNYITTGNLFGLQYIYGNMSASFGVDPLDFDAVARNPAQMVFPATNALTGEIKYFTKSDLKQDHYEAIMATCALPVMCRPIQIDGDYYFDGGVGASLPIEQMLRDGCSKVVVLFSKPKEYRMQPQGHKWMYTMSLRKKYPKMVELLDKRHIQYNASLDRIAKLKEEGKIFALYPSSKIKITTYTTDPAIMQSLYDCGVNVAIEQMEELKEFMRK